MNADFEEFWDVEDDWEEEEKELVVLDVLIGQNRGEAQLAVVADPNVTLETGRRRRKEKGECADGISKYVCTYASIVRSQMIFR